ncbi:DUF4159 domain-containing protein [Chloroflexota bacterium]
MEHTDILNFQFKRENSFSGLALDVDTWQEAHNYHRDQQRFHVLAYHNTGILKGLEVVAHDPPDLAITITSGISIDPDGNNIIVSQSQRYTLQNREKGMAYIVIQFREVPTGPYQPPDGGQPTRIIEAYQIQVRDQLPVEAHLELARIDFDPTLQAIIDHSTPDNPGINEIDQRFRQGAIYTEQIQPMPSTGYSAKVIGSRKISSVSAEAFAPGTAIVLGHLSLGEAKDLHLNGLRNLAMEINRQYDFVLEIEENVSLDKTLKCKMLYITGNNRFKLSAQQEKALADFIRVGGTILGEGCSEVLGESQNEGAKEFGFAFNQLANQLNCRLEKVQRGHSLLSSVHIFASVPQGAQQGIVMEGGHMVYSGSDYGCAWQGGYQSSPLSRSVIRDAIEIGANLSFYAQIRYAGSH